MDVLLLVVTIAGVPGVAYAKAEDNARSLIAFKERRDRVARQFGSDHTARVVRGCGITAEVLSLSPIFAAVNLNEEMKAHDRYIMR